MSKASRERERARLANRPAQQLRKSDLIVGSISLRKADISEIPDGPAKKAVEALAFRYPDGFAVQNRDEWGWVTQIENEVALFSSNLNGEVAQHFIPASQYGG